MGLGIYFEDSEYHKLTEQRFRKVCVHQSEWLRSKSLQVINAGEGVEKREPSYTVGGNVN